MERFVKAVTGGGLALIAGLWITTLSTRATLPLWLFGVVLVLVGIGGLAVGIYDELEY